MWTLWPGPNWKRTSYDYCLPILHGQKEISILSEFTSVNWQPSFFTFKTILIMADGDPDFITPVCSFVSACFATKMQSMIFAKMFTYLRPTTVNPGLLLGPHRESPNGGVANDWRWLCPTYTRGCLHKWTIKCFNYLSTNVNCHQSSYWILGNRSLFIPMFFILTCIVVRACPLSSPVSISSVCHSPCLYCM